jgi:hypothetical protein
MPFSGTCCRVGLLLSDVSEDHVASIFMVEEIIIVAMAAYWLSISRCTAGCDYEGLPSVTKLCSLAEVNHCFEGIFCLRLKGKVKQPARHVHVPPLNHQTSHSRWRWYCYRTGPRSALLPSQLCPLCDGADTPEPRATYGDT